MNDLDVVDGIGAAALGLAIVAAAWLLLSPGPGASRADEQVRVSDRTVTSSLDARHRPLDQARHCSDAVAAAGVAGCVAAPLAPTTPSDRAVDRATPATGVSARLTQVSPPSTSTLQQVTLQPTTLQLATLSSPTPSSPTPSSPARQSPGPTSSPHDGPVPGGSTSPPQTGPSP
jgi:hypothetical protein